MEAPGRALLIEVVVSREAELEVSGGTLTLAVVVGIALEAVERVLEEVVGARVDDGELVATLDAVEGSPDEAVETILELSDDCMLK